MGKQKVVLCHGGRSSSMTLTLKGVNADDFVNYKKPSMFLCFPTCTFKCNKDCGAKVCQNMHLVNEKSVQYRVSDIIDTYFSNPISKAIVCGGMEPFDSADELLGFITEFRDTCNDDIVIYSGYSEEEVKEKFPWVYNFQNMVVKYGRYLPGHSPHHDEVLGVDLASDNQYARKYNEVEQ